MKRSCAAVYENAFTAKVFAGFFAAYYYGFFRSLKTESHRHIRLQPA